MLGSITVTEREELKVHTYSAPEDGWAVNTHVIELADQLVVIDAQYTLVYANEVLAYAAMLNKPILRLYITHYHPDHLLGAAAFASPIFGLPEVAKKIEQVGDRVAGEERAKVGAAVPDHAERITDFVHQGQERIGGTLFRHIELHDAETANSLMIAIPEHGILITQDLLYHQVHAFVGELAFESWRKALTEFSRLGYGVVLPGHGAPGGPELWAGMDFYLYAAEKAWKESADADTFKKTMIDLFPNFGGRVLLGHQGRFLYKSR
jgi:glyoxylase-like metal-dependent hydrolase (beta-lactamase superfamily II)